MSGLVTCGEQVAKLRVALDEILRGGKCGWSRKVARNALDENSVDEQERKTLIDKRMVVLEQGE